ncbi:MAG: hypothetical protein L6302_09680 [Desulfobacteraceae bacterium]|nr:hypothetical protein [Desulfobacteraceae bacterium]
MADGGDANNSAYGKYLRLEESSPIAYTKDFGQIENTNTSESFGLLYQLADSTSIYVIREKSGYYGKGFKVSNDSERAEVITNLIEKKFFSNNEQLLIITHHKIDEKKLQGISTKEIMWYRTGGDEGTACEWKLVCEIVDECLSKKQSLSFEQIKEKIKYCTIKKKIRVIIHKLELLIAPLKIECEDKEGRPVDIDNEINQQISCLVAGANCSGKTEEFLNRCCGGKSLKQLLEEGKYLSNDEMSDIVKPLKVIPTGSQNVSDVRNICKEFYNNLQFISKKIFFEKRQGELP